MKGWYGFAEGHADGSKADKNLLGGKGAGLAEMSRLNIPVPPGFTLPTTSCLAFYEQGEKLSDAILSAIDQGIAFIESRLGGAKLGDARRPLLVSVRSGARVSMPGMMDTVLNIGLTPQTLEGLVASTGNERFALDSYRRLIQMYGDVVMGVDKEALHKPIEALKARRGVDFDHQLVVDDLRTLVTQLLEVYRKATGAEFPKDAQEQVRQAVRAVFQSWNGKRARTYRDLNGIPHDWGTATNVQAMVFGNYGPTSATGVAFTRNPSTGDKRVLGEWLPNAQGEDVVAGIRTPGPLHADEPRSAVGSLQGEMPKAYEDLLNVMSRLEQHYHDVQDVEFTIQEGRLYLLQTRSAKRTAAAALRCAVDMVGEKLIDQVTAIRRVGAEQVGQLLHPQLDPKAKKELLAKGLPASPGAACGKIVLTADEAEARAKRGEDVILVRKETSPEDIHGMHAARGILTATGGMTSHAAVVARGMGRCCVAGCAALHIDLDRGDSPAPLALSEAEGSAEVNSADSPQRDRRFIEFRLPAGVVTLAAGDEITLDGSLGHVFRGRVPTVAASLSGDFGTFMAWTDTHRRLGVRANADTPEDARKAVELGASGIGLCRTEHMFFDPKRILAVRQMIVARDQKARATALALIAPMQRQDFVEIFRVMAGRPVTVRLLDPPLHEFLPHEEGAQKELAQSLGISLDTLRGTVDSLHEFNPMLGHRGCRLGITYPEIYEMQIRTILEAACIVKAEGVSVLPEIMVPLVMHPEELRRSRVQAEQVSKEVFAAHGVTVPYLLGTMIELPRAALVADQIAAHADFFSFGTNDLTQTALGLSRDDAGRFLPAYVEGGVLADDPFVKLDIEGVGALVRMATEKGRAKNPKLKVGICGEHGGDPSSVAFFHSVGLDYVSCSPFRVPVARVAAAQAALAALA